VNDSSVTAPLVETTAGVVSGIRLDDVELFVEIPYAAPPVGAARFKPPRPPAPWDGVRPADTWRYRTPQNPDTGHLRTPKKFFAMLGERYAPELSEDSLTLNVWTPSTSDGKRRPVLFFMHGGGYVFGHAGAPSFDGERFARDHDMVFVSVTHRLNAFGFLYLEGIGGAEYQGSGNAGMLDLVAALEWVRDNIARFGGDPGNVTISGESGGAAKVSTLMVMGAAEGLFHRALCESGTALSAITPESSEAYAFELIRELGGTDISALVDASMQDLLDAQARIGREDPSPIRLGPVIDGVVLTDTPLAIWRSGGGSRVPLMTGWTRDEVALFSPDDIDADLEVPDSFHAKDLADIPGGFSLTAGGLSAVSAWIGKDSDAVIAARRELAPEESDDVIARRILSDVLFRRPAERLAELRCASDFATWVYRFDWESPLLSPLGAPHCAGIALFFEDTDLVPFSRDSDAAHRIAALMGGALASFARHGDPSHESDLEWPTWDADRRAVMIFDEVSRVEDDPDSRERIELDKLNPASLL
jgi:para-nitrobenzyl esterase